MKKAISYLYREILLKVNEELNRLYDSKFDEDQKYREPIEKFRLKYKALNLDDVENFDEDKCKELYIESSDNWIGDNDIVYDALYEFRESGTPIDNKIDESPSFYPNREVCKRITGLCKIFLAWTYYFGGGKYGEPWKVEWMEDCYLVRVKEIEEVRVVKIYEKVGE